MHFVKTPRMALALSGRLVNSDEEDSVPLETLLSLSLAPSGPSKRLSFQTLKIAYRE